ncbi:MAG: hypothetical protein GF344_01075, partial [Chitinivibrionales bacterium]|nr:hypothetical protein [Chitinivibrionales bacterium]MBD3355693.1 hypothetical protein [Chitinivibrionales bacterium]
RLMNLLVRLVRREGNRHVFELNDERLHYAVRAYWERTLSDLFRRGALRGRRPEDAFRVVMNEGLDQVWSKERGRFYVDLLVAPARPMKFITIRLVRTTTEQVLVEEL